MGCKFCDSPYDECDCWKCRISPNERILLTNAMLAKRDLLPARTDKPVVVMRGQFGIQRRKKA